MVQGHIYFLPYSVIKMEKSVCSIYTDCTIITIKLSLVKYFIKNITQDKLLVIVQQCILFLSQLKVRFFFVNYTYVNIIIIIIIITTFDISVPLTSEMIATPLPCNITEYKTLAIFRVIFIWASNICGSTWILFGRKGAKMALLTLKVADPCLKGIVHPVIKICC